MKKLKSDGNERDWYLVKEWVTKSGLNARIQKCVWRDDLKGMARFLHDFYTGYVQVPENVKIKNTEKLDVHGGITFGYPEPKKLSSDIEGEFVGFDTAHLGDENNQDLDYVESECERLAEQIIAFEDVASRRDKQN